MKINESIDEIDKTKYWRALLTVEDHLGSNPHLTVIEKTSNFIVLNFDCSSLEAVCLAYAMIKSVGIMNDIPTENLLKFCEDNIEVKRSNRGVTIHVPEDLASDGN